MSAEGNKGGRWRAGRLEGKVCFVTGGALGLGRAIGEAFAGEGASVVLADRQAELGLEAAKAIPGASFLPLDVTDEAAWISALKEAMAHRGRLDVLVNCAGIAVVGSVERTSLEDWRRCQSVNVEGTFLGCKHGIQHLRASGGGSIINISSVAGITAAPKLVAYAASKGAVRAMTKSIAIDLAQRGDGIRCNSIHPIFAATAMVDEITSHARDPGQARENMAAGIPLGRLAEPADVAGMAVYLASDESRYVTGTEMLIDGGFTAA